MKQTRNRHLSAQSILLLLISVTLISCIDPVPPEFEYKDGLVFIEGIAATSPNNSFVSVSRSATEYNIYAVKFVPGAAVTFINTETGEHIPLSENKNIYLPPTDFAVTPGESWEVDILLPDGTHYRSLPEKVLEPVPITGITSEYSTKLKFSEATESFIPGHNVSIDFADPAGTRNYYYWSFRSFETLGICEKCRMGIFRNGECQSNPPNSGLKPYYDYPCETDCWRIRFPESITVIDDKFIDGNKVSQLQVAQLPLYTKEDMVVEVQQFSITPDAFEYYKILRDIIDDTKGLNAPPPAALIGNIINVDQSEDFVFGRFTAAATSVRSVFIDRSEIKEVPLERKEPVIIEGFGETPPPETASAPCSETRFRTAIRPEKWVDQ